MNIGMTYDLRSDYLARGYSLDETAEFDSLRTIEGIESVLIAAGHAVERIGGIDALVERLSGGRRWDLVFNIAEGLYGFGREAAIPALLEAWRIPCTFSDSLTLAVCLHKATTKRLVRDAGIPTPDFRVVEHLGDVDGFSLEFPVFAKPVAEGTSKGVTGASLVEDERALRRVCESLLMRHAQPVLVERYLPGREFTVGILGSGGSARVLGVMEVVADGGGVGAVYSYAAKQEYEERVSYHLALDREARASAELAMQAWAALGCRDAGRVDVRLDARGVPMFIEANPLPGLNPDDSDLPIICRLAGISYSDLITGIVQLALKRQGEAAPPMARAEAWR
ncbi:D-alanine--D-alanine ligase family protein [Desulfobaculum sp.]